MGPSEPIFGFVPEISGPSFHSPTRVGRRVAAQPRGPMTYCLGIRTREGLVFASDSRTNAGMDQVNTCRKLHTLVQPGERVFVLLTSGSLSLSQSVMTLLK